MNISKQIKLKILEMYETAKKSNNPYVRSMAEFPAPCIDTVCFDRLNNKAVYVVFEKNKTSMVEVSPDVIDGEYYTFVVSDMGCKQ